jgi:predicted DNA repair protein MutK
MAGSSLLLLIDDIAAVLDDVALMTKVAAKKTAGVLGDDLALNAEQVSGVRAERELPVVWAVAKGSMINKAILVPAALVISAFAPWLITPMLMIGGAYLCYEGVEKLAHKLLYSDSEEKAEENALKAALHNPHVDMAEFEKEKIKGAIRTDFVLSAEIIVITLGAVAQAVFLTQVAAVIAVAIIMTVGVYGFVALIVKLDDMGLHLLSKPGQGAWLAFQHSIGKGLLLSAPVLMKVLAVVGTAAMFLVGGGILAHGLPFMHKLTHSIAHYYGDFAATLASSLLNMVLGVVVGAIVLVAVTLISKLFAKPSAKH